MISCPRWLLNDVWNLRRLRLRRNRIPQFCLPTLQWQLWAFCSFIFSPLIYRNDIWNIITSDAVQCITIYYYMLLYITIYYYILLYICKHRVIWCSFPSWQTVVLRWRRRTGLWTRRRQIIKTRPRVRRRWANIMFSTNIEPGLNRVWKRKL